MAADGLGTVLVTGGASGLGAAVAAAVEAEGGTPVVLDRQPPPNGFAFRPVDLAQPRAAEAAVRAVVEEHGGLDAVVTVASTLGLRALPAATAYCASKFGIVGFTRALASELGDRVGVTMLVPGGMRTHFFDDRPEQFKPAPDQRLNDPADVARAVLFALRQPAGCELRELVVAPATEPSWP